MSTALDVRREDIERLTAEEEERLEAILQAPEPVSFREFVDEVFSGFNWYWHCEVLAERLQEVVEGHRDRLMVFMPPRHGKSELISRLLPAYYLYRHPQRVVGITSHGGDYARDKLSVHARRYYRRWGGVLSDEQSAKKRWQNVAGGEVWAAGAQGPITGSGFHLGIIDDPIKNAQEADSVTHRERNQDWYDAVFDTRGEPGEAQVIVQTRWHEDDLSGWLLQREPKDPQHWHVVHFPAIAEERPEYPSTCTVEPDPREEGEPLCPERKPLEDLAGYRNRSAYYFAALYQGSPSPAEGGIIKRGWWQFHRFDVPAFDQLIQSWDMAFKGKETSDYVVGQVWGRVGSDKFLLDQRREKMEFTDAIEAVLQMTRKWPKATAKYVEDKANGPAVMSALSGEVSGLIPYDPGERSKAARYRAVSPQIEAGDVHLPHPDEFPWVEAFIEECARAPNGAHDDQADAMAQALDVLEAEVGADSDFAFV